MKFSFPNHNRLLRNWSWQGMILTATFISPVGVLAEDLPDVSADYFVVTENDSTQILFPVLDKPMITLNNLAVNIHSDTKTYSAEIANIIDFSFIGNNINAVSSISTLNKSIEHHGNYIIIKGLSKGEAVSLFGLNGETVSTYISKEDNLSVDLDLIPAGVYILSTKNANYKIMK